jgi:WhiB family redox-sensing transcriptional regulator
VVQTWARYDHEKEAKAICAECPYKIRCLEYALKNHEQGIWGGTTERDRRRILTAIKTNQVSRRKV